jgi:hypothetical protein
MFVVSKGVCSITPSKLNTEQQIAHGFSNRFHWALFAHNFEEAVGDNLTSNTALYALTIPFIKQMLHQFKRN